MDLLARVKTAEAFTGEVAGTFAKITVTVRTVDYLGIEEFVSAEYQVFGPEAHNALKLTKGEYVCLRNVSSYMNEKPDGKVYHNSKADRATVIPSDEIKEKKILIDAYNASQILAQATATTDDSLAI